MMVITSQGPPAFPDLPDHAPGVAKARHTAATAEAAQDRVGVGAYVAESSYFQTDWQRAYWGLNYA
ncbi:MAG: hypothetical protein J2P48_16270 [Alphaproteobacteria bacterium]|nr:hypothetical protein [Alphaproteobacteria bacterium]